MNFDNTCFDTCTKDNTMEGKKVIEIIEKSQCCGCEACANICPKQAINMIPDEHGFLYPEIDNSRCVDCGVCEKVCPLNGVKEDNNKDFDVYAAINKDAVELKNSASGGAFSALAHWTIDNGGVVFGCAWDDKLMPRHIKINSLEQIGCLQGSKYVQGRIGTAYKEIKKCLDRGEFVLFSGTPCQCDGLRRYLQKDYERLICVELICHGAPSALFFREYLDLLEQKINGKILDVKFRDKKRGWGALLHIIYKDKHNRKRDKYLTTDESFYYHYFWGANLYRESCYKCLYSELPRKSDLTIGDFWGIQKLYPNLDYNKGVSVMIASTAKGKRTVLLLKDYLELYKADIENASAENGQLVKTSTKGGDTERLWKLYDEEGIKKIQEDYIEKNYKKIIVGRIKRYIPVFVKRMVIRLIQR